MTGDESGRGPRWRFGLVLGAVAVGAAVLAGLYVDAASDRADLRRRAAELAAQEAALRGQVASLRADVDTARDRAAAADARFAAVEPCLRQIVATPSPRPVSEAELRDFFRRQPPTRGGSGYAILDFGGKTLFPACKDVNKQLTR